MTYSSCRLVQDDTKSACCFFGSFFTFQTNPLGTHNKNGF